MEGKQKKSPRERDGSNAKRIIATHASERKRRGKSCRGEGEKKRLSFPFADTHKRCDILKFNSVFLQFFPPLIIFFVV
jgi:hypothetical protein